MVNWPFITAYYTDSTNFQNSLWFDEDFDVSIPHRPTRICIINSGLDPLFWGSWSDLPYYDPAASTNTYNEISISFGNKCLRGGVWDLVNIVSAWMSLDNLLTQETTIVGELFDTLYYFVSGLLYANFNSDYIIRHTSLYLPPLHCPSVKWIPLKYEVVDEYFLETYTKKPRTCSNFLWFNSSLFCASEPSHSIFCRYFPQFPSSTQNNNSFCWDVIISTAHGQGSLLGSFLFNVSSWIPRYMHFVEILLPTTHTYSSDETIITMLSILVHNSAAKFPSLSRFDTHGRLS